MAKAEGCARPTGKVLGAPASTQTPPAPTEPIKEMIMTARVGHQAPDFEAPAYYQGAFTTVKLSDYLGKWILVCFYPGDFTYV